MEVTPVDVVQILCSGISSRRMDCALTARIAGVMSWKRSWPRMAVNQNERKELNSND
jgi:hypothetical protein